MVDEMVMSCAVEGGGTSENERLEASEGGAASTPSKTDHKRSRTPSIRIPTWKELTSVLETDA